MTLRFLAAALAAFSLAGCGGSSPPVRSAPPPKAKPATVTPAPPPPARIQPVPGLEGVIGASPDSLIRQLGQPRLDIHEGDARKLQWSGTACILDVYFYPPPNDGQQTATYIEARRGDGREVDRVACVAALKKP